MENKGQLCCSHPGTFHHLFLQELPLKNPTLPLYALIALVPFILPHVTMLVTFEVDVQRFWESRCCSESSRTESSVQTANYLQYKTDAAAFSSFPVCEELVGSFWPQTQSETIWTGRSGREITWPTKCELRGGGGGGPNSWMFHWTAATFLNQVFSPHSRPACHQKVDSWILQVQQFIVLRLLTFLLHLHAHILITPLPLGHQDTRKWCRLFFLMVSISGLYSCT